MKSIFKIFGSLFALLLFVNILSGAEAAAEEPYKLVMSAENETVSHGDALHISIFADGTFLSRGAGITICYDSALLKPDLDSCTVGENLPFTVSGPIKLGEKSALRISFFPKAKDETVSIEANEILAKLVFSTRTPSDSCFIEMSRAYIYDESLKLLDIEKADSLEVKIESVPASGIELDKQEMVLEIGKSGLVTATVKPENASDKTVIWTCDNSEVATVDDKGRVFAVGLGEATITATAADYSANCRIVVCSPPDAGYMVGMPTSKMVVVDEIVSIAPKITNQHLDVYNAYDFAFSYDPKMLELNEDKLLEAGITVSAAEDGFSLLHFGDETVIEENATEKPFVLEFRARATGETKVSLVEARVDYSENALIENASLARPLREVEETIITISAYPVTLPTDFESSVYAVEPGEEFVFTAKSPYYLFNFAQSTMGGQPLTGVERDGEDVILHFGGTATEDISELFIAPGENGKFKIPNVKGRLVIQAQKQGKSYGVTISGSDITGNSQARYGEDYYLTFSKEDGFTYNLKIKIGGVLYEYGRLDSTIVIPGFQITGEISVAMSKVEIINPDVTPTMYYSVKLPELPELEGGSASVVSGGSVSFKLNKLPGYSYQLSYTMGDGPEQSLWPDENDTYTIANISGDVVLTVIKTADPEESFKVEVYNYIELDSQTMYLVLVTGVLDDSQVYTYGDEAMYYSDGYKAWCYLTVESEVLTESMAKKQISTQANTPFVIRHGDCDINLTERVDINDAQLAYDMYKARHLDFESIHMRSFLRADVNCDKKIALNDVVAVIHAIE